MKADYIYTKKDGSTIHCYGKARNCLTGESGMVISLDYSNKWALLDVTKTKKQNETQVSPDGNEIRALVWEHKDFNSKQEAEEYRNNYKGDSKLVIRNMANWEGAEYYGESFEWEGLTEEEFQEEYESDLPRPYNWKQICIHIEKWENSFGIRPLVTQLEEC
mgnify:CR=1 FL=1